MRCGRRAWSRLLQHLSTLSASVLDIEGVAGVAHEIGVPLAVDNTVPTPYLSRPLEHGADIIVHSATKFIGGHGPGIAGGGGGGGTFDFSPPTAPLPPFSPPDPRYHPLHYCMA